MSQIPIANGFYQAESLAVSNQRCVNLFPVVQEAPSVSQETLRGTPGLSQLLTTGIGTAQQQNRGAWQKGGRAYFVNGLYLYGLSFVSAGVYEAEELGEIGGTGRVSMASSQTELMVLIPGGDAFIYNEDAVTPFEKITDSDFRANGDALHVVYLDGLFVCTTDENKIIHSNLNQGLVWSALDFGSVESDPDDVVAPVVVNNQLYVTGSITTEGFRNTGGDQFVFTRSNVFMDKGCVSPFTLINANQSFFMIGKGDKESPAIWQSAGNVLERRSTRAIDNVLYSLRQDELDNAYAFYYSQKGSYFVVFTVGSYTFVYDLTTERWHERYSIVDDVTVPWRAASLVAAYGYILAGDRHDGRIGILDTDEYAEYGEHIESWFTLQPFFNLDGISLPMLELTMEQGVATDQDQDPQVALAVSRDSVVFHSDRMRGIGKIGERTRRTIWRRNGQVDKNTVLRFKISEKVKKVFIRLDAV